jgi:hypothetical protein
MERKKTRYRYNIDVFCYMLKTYRKYIYIYVKCKIYVYRYFFPLYIFIHVYIMELYICYSEKDRLSLDDACTHINSLYIYLYISAHRKKVRGIGFLHAFF